MWKRISSLWRNAWRRDEFEVQLDEELEFHLQSRASDLRRSGLSPSEAARQARLEFGSSERVREECREAGGLWLLDEFWRNLRFAFRTLRKSPAFTISAVLTLGLCIGANTAILSLVDAVLLRPLPYPQPERLMTLVAHFQTSRGEGLQQGHSGRSWETFRDQADFVERAVFSTTSGGVNLLVGKSPRHVQLQRVGSGFFRVLGIDPLVGRGFTQQEDQPGGPAAAVVSHTLAASLQSDPRAALGQTLLVRGVPHPVVGVMPPGFKTAQPADIWTPLRAHAEGEGGGINYQILVRVPADANLEQIDSRIAAVGSTIAQDMPISEDTVVRFRLVPLQESITDHLYEPLTVLWGAVALVLLIGCVNIAGLLLARNGWRARETAIRSCLGGGRAAVIRQMLTESLVLSLMGGVLGVFLGYWGKSALQTLMERDFFIWQAVSLDTRVLAVSALVAILTSILFGLAPALQASRLDVVPALSLGGSRGVSGGSGNRVQRALVVGEIALGMVLLVAAGLLIRTIAEIHGLQPGFDPSHVVSARVSLNEERYSNPASVQQFFNAVVQELARRPGIESASAGLSLPYERPLNMGFQRLGSADIENDQSQLTTLYYVTPGYFETLGISLQQGRSIEDSDGADTLAVAVVNRRFVERFYPETEALGKDLLLSGKSRRIVGIVGDVQHRLSWGQSSAVSLGSQPGVYLPVSQISEGFLRVVHNWFSPAIVARSPKPGLEVVEDLKSAVGSIDANLPLFAVHPMSEIMGASWSRQRVQAVLMGSLALLALLLSAVGLYGLIANSVVERRREMGIRMALGATVWRAVGSVTLGGLRLALIGIIIGSVAAMLGTPLIEHLIWGVSPTDPWTFLGVSTVLLFTAAAASLLPSARLARLDPARTLREE